jgi:hypothetical protein
VPELDHLLKNAETILDGRWAPQQIQSTINQRKIQIAQRLCGAKVCAD